MKSTSYIFCKHNAKYKYVKGMLVKSSGLWYLLLGLAHTLQHDYAARFGISLKLEALLDETFFFFLTWCLHLTSFCSVSSSVNMSKQQTLFFFGIRFCSFVSVTELLWTRQAGSMLFGRYENTHSRETKPK